ncbi:MAG TPA: von Willebrand factor type A domain-containing protein [Mucilaginibacter sp.]|jgi:Ca-activated chloride channel family protein|nr:von Willebrand factor type A domain-containing protein [Mucilaginibacter sp.]
MKKLILITLIATAALVAFRSDTMRHIHGTVYGSDDKLPIIGASVHLKGSNIGVVTNQSGKYTIDVPDGGTLVFSYIGYQAKTIVPGTRDSLDVYLDPSNSTLNEVVVTDYSTQRKKDVTGSVATIGADQVAITPQALSAPVVQNQAAQLSGRVAGVGVYARNSKKSKNAPAGFFNNTANPQDESYKTIIENGFSSAKDNPLSTFSVDVDAASYSNVRRFINNGQLPPPDAVRVEEMINYFKYNMEAPKSGDPVGITTEMSSAPWNKNHLLVRIGLKARSIDMSKLPPSNLVFLLDISGSMGEPNKLPLVKASMKMLVDQLRPEDRVAIVVYSGEVAMKLPSTPGDEKQKIKDAIDELEAGGSTAGGAGIKMAYKIARENFMKKGNNRIIMCTDGDFNVGDSSDGDMETLITRERYSNVPITIMGFGIGNLKDSKMEILADKGNGNYAYIDNLTEAQKTLINEYGGTMYMVAKDVKLQVEFNPALVQAYRLVGYEDRLLNKEDFNNDQKDAGDMGSGHTVTAFYEIVPTGVKDDYSHSVDPLKYQSTAPAVTPTGHYANEMMTVKFRYKQPDSDKSKLSVAVVMNKPASFNSASSDFRFASAVAEFGMLLRNSQFKQNASFDQAIDIAKNAKGGDEDGYRSEFVRLAQTAKSLAGNRYATN